MITKCNVVIHEILWAYKSSSLQTAQVDAMTYIIYPAVPLSLRCFCMHSFHAMVHAGFGIWYLGRLHAGIYETCDMRDQHRLACWNSVAWSRDQLFETHKFRRRRRKFLSQSSLMRVGGHAKYDA